MRPRFASSPSKDAIHQHRMFNNSGTKNTVRYKSDTAHTADTRDKATGKEIFAFEKINVFNRTNKQIGLNQADSIE